MHLISGIWRQARRLIPCTRATAVLELAFAAPVLFVAIAGVVEVSMVMFTITLMEGGLREASRFGITGNIPAGVTREQRILSLIEENTIGLVDAANSEVTYKIYPSFGDVGKPEPFTDSNPVNGSYDPGEAFVDVNGNGQWDSDMGLAGLGGPGDVVLYTVTADWRLLTPLVAPLMGNDGVMRLKASVAVRNEPFPAAGG